MAGPGEAATASGPVPDDTMLAGAAPDRVRLRAHAYRTRGSNTVSSRSATTLAAITAAEKQERAGIEYRIDHHRAPWAARSAGELFLVTNEGAAEFRLMTAPVAAPGRANWSAVRCAACYPARGDTRLISCDVLGRSAAADPAPRRRTAAGDRRDRRRPGTRDSRGHPGLARSGSVARRATTPGP